MNATKKILNFLGSLVVLIAIGQTCKAASAEESSFDESLPDAQELLQLEDDLLEVHTNLLIDAVAEMLDETDPLCGKVKKMRHTVSGGDLNKLRHRISRNRSLSHPIASITTEVQISEVFDLSDFPDKIWDCERCPICLNNFAQEQSVALLHCGHILCKSCVKQSLQQASRCPLCRVAGNQFQMVPKPTSS